MAAAVRVVPFPKKTATVTLIAGEKMTNPASTHRMIYGPALVEVIYHEEGGIDAYVRDLPVRVHDEKVRK